MDFTPRECRIDMKTVKRVATITAVLLLSALPRPSVRPGAQGASTVANPSPPPEQIHALFARAIENQHRNDQLLDEEFERTERVITRKDGSSSEVVTDHTSRVLPTGTGIMRIDVPMDHSAASTEAYSRDLRQAIAAYELAMHPNDREKQDLVRFEKRRRERTELLDNAGKAFRATWAGRETRGSRTLAKFLLEPNPDYRPTTRFGSVFQHVHAAIWIDEQEAQMVQVDADIDSDIGFGGGIVYKVYRGGHIVMEQQEVEPGIWMPTLFTYDLDGRKFLFGFGVHERTEISAYRRIGQPAQAIEIIRKELNNPVAESATH
jgi:hypothetical protein